MKIALDSDLSFLTVRLKTIPGVSPITLLKSSKIKPPVHADALVCTAVNGAQMRDTIMSCKGLKWIHVLGTGVNDFPFDLVTDARVTCSRGATAGPISEWVLAMMLAYEKQLPERWITKPPKAWYMADLGSLDNQTLGLIGFGAIGQAIAKKARAFDMNIIAKVRTYRKSPSAHIQFEPELETLLARSDHIVLALPSTSQTHHLINAKALKQMKPGVHLINVARADLIDQDALCDSLDNGHVGRASLDVVSPEPLPKTHWMYTHPRIRLSAHISWSSPTSHDKIMAPFFENVNAALKGRPLTGVVDRQIGY